MIMRVCPDCGGSGNAEDGALLYDLPHLSPGAVCMTCEGRGELPEAPLSSCTALVRLRHTSSDLLTDGYVAERMHAAKCFMEGWAARHDDCSVSGGAASPDYATIRDYLRGGFDTDPIVAALVALWLTRESVRGTDMYWLSFRATFYEAEG